MKYARIINNVAVDVREDSPEGCFTPEIVSSFEQVDDTCFDGYTLIKNIWTAPVVVEPTIVEPINLYAKVSPIEFKMLFTSQERIAIKTAKVTDEILQDVFEIIDDVRLTEVDLGLKSVQDLLAYLGALKILTEPRIKQILSAKTV